MNLGDMIDDVRDALMLEGITEVPSVGRIVRVLNRAKNDMVNRAELVYQPVFMVRKDYTVTSGDTSISLPDGSGDDAAVHRIMGLHTVVAGTETQVALYDQRDVGTHDSSAGFWGWREGGTIYFSGTNGIDYSGTLRLRYTPQVADLDEDDTTAEYDYLPAGWTDLIPPRAILSLLPGNAPGRAKYQNEYTERLMLVEAAANRPDASTPLSVRRAEDHYGGAY